jgi:AcrR family transcriptional regulator
MSAIFDPEDRPTMKTSRPKTPTGKPVVKVAAVKAAPAVSARKKAAASTVATLPTQSRAAQRALDVQEAPAKPAAPTLHEVHTPERTVRRNKRSDGTIANILAATEEVVLRAGADRISIMEVCEFAGVSRGTFYRYFSSQEELLDAFSLHKREQFHQALIDVTLPHTDPKGRLLAVTQYLENYLDSGRARRLLLVAPEYALSFFERVHHDAAARFQDVLGIVFDDWDARLGTQLDRELICELIIRYVLSELMVPAGERRRELTGRITQLVNAFSGLARPRSLVRA